MNVLNKSAWATIIYYDVLNWPLTESEILRFLINPQRMADGSNFSQSDTVKIESLRLVLKKSLAELVERQKIDFSLGFYHLLGRHNLISERLEEQKISEIKWKKARRYLWWVQFLPYIDGVLASGSLALGNTKEESDLDVLVIVRSGRIWLGRLLIFLLTSLLGVRRQAQQLSAPDKICLNHYITSNDLTIDLPSLYNAQTYLSLVPLYLRRPQIWFDFWKANQWLRKFVLFLPDHNIYQKREVDRSGWLRLLRDLGEVLLELFRLGGLFNAWARLIQKPRIKTGLPGRVVADDQRLEFHPHSVEGEVLLRYNKKLRETGYFGEYAEVDSGLKSA